MHILFLLALCLMSPTAVPAADNLSSMTAGGKLAELKAYADLHGNQALIHEISPSGSTLLMIACHYEQKEMIQELIRPGIDVNLKDHQGIQPWTGWSFKNRQKTPTINTA